MNQLTLLMPEHERAELRSHCGAEVALAIKRGDLPRVGYTVESGIACVDCGKPAKCYDHRSYYKPLDVDPVCYGCNAKRGAAVPVADKKRKPRCWVADFPTRRLLRMAAIWRWRAAWDFAAGKRKNRRWNSMQIMQELYRRGVTRQQFEAYCENIGKPV